jgi:hypothetical protein
MISLTQKRALAPWLPAAFCAALSLITMANHSDVEGWAISFLCWLPFSFFLVGLPMSEMRREIAELRKQVAELRQDNGETHDDATP